MFLRLPSYEMPQFILEYGYWTQAAGVELKSLFAFQNLTTVRSYSDHITSFVR